jgi:hypothetical protein
MPEVECTLIEEPTVILGDRKKYFLIPEDVTLTISAPHARVLPEGPTIREMTDFWNEHHPRET